MKAKKYFGQNFLIDENILKKICDNVPANEDDLIIEIGPGMGALTKYLTQKNCNMICYEIDTDLIPYLNKLTDNKVIIKNEDILKSNIQEDIRNINYKNLYIVGNLPYYITTSIIKYIIGLNINIESMVFMVQKEVAERFSAKPNSKDYGSITLYLKYYFDIEKLFDVSKYCFNPVPKVESSIIRFNKRIDKIDVDTNKYFNLINDSFKMKRKTLKNNLSNYDFNKIYEVLKQNNLPENVRAEELSEKVFVEIANIL